MTAFGWEADIRFTHDIRLAVVEPETPAVDQKLGWLPHVHSHLWTCHMSVFRIAAADPISPYPVRTTDRLTSSLPSAPDRSQRC